MELITSSEKHPSLEEVQAQFEQWRRSRGKRQAIPASLWAAASSLYPSYSLHRISKTLGLNHTKLKHHIKRPSPGLPMEAAEAFIELGFASPSPDRQCVVDMRHCNIHSAP